MLDPERQYVLVLADLKGSTQLPSAVREKVFGRLETVLRRWNRRRADRPELPLSLAYGDEVAGLFTRHAPVAVLLRELRDALAPETTMRFAVVRGHIGRASKDVRQVGGDVFKTASRLVDELKRSGGRGAWCLGGDELTDRTLGALSELIESTLVEMTDWQREVYVELAKGRTQTAIAAQRERTPQAISEAARRGGAARVIQAEAVVADWMEHLDRTMIAGEEEDA